MNLYATACAVFEKEEMVKSKSIILAPEKKFLNELQKLFILHIHKIHLFDIEKNKVRLQTLR